MSVRAVKTNFSLMPPVILFKNAHEITGFITPLQNHTGGGGKSVAVSLADTSWNIFAVHLVPEERSSMFLLMLLFGRGCPQSHGGSLLQAAPRETSLSTPNAQQLSAAKPLLLSRTAFSLKKQLLFS